MSVDRTYTYYCEATDCDSQGTTGSSPPHLPPGTIETREVIERDVVTHHFCSWDCAMRYAASRPIPEVIES